MECPVSDARTALAAALAGHYRIERVLGEGGMATVYLAHDLKHDRPVALKVLKPELAHALGPERFEREIKLAARLQHPHILTVLDSGEIGPGRETRDASGESRVPQPASLFFTMPYVEGESLRSRLDREKQLSLDDAIRIAREAALALEYAHQHGVVHRDIKPENLLLTSDGSTLVADFGIARGLASGDERLTRTGTSIGTAAYMSPEQAAGEQAVDARSDIYSLAIVLYEMLAGETPFAAATPQATIARRFTDTPRLLRTVRELVPEPVERAVQKALSRTTADRFASARQFAEALQLPAMTAATPAPGTLVATPAEKKPRRWSPALVTLTIGFILGLGVLFAWRSRQGDAVPAGPRLLAVLPFESIGDSANAYFADGVTDEVRGKLSGLATLRVIAGGSSKDYRGSNKSLLEIGRELGVSYLLVGKVRWARSPDGSELVRVSPELVQVSGNTPISLWQQPFDADPADVFKVQAQIAGQVAAALGAELGSQEQHEIARSPTSNSAAYDLYLKGQALSSPDAGSSRQAAQYYEQAVALDSTFVEAWAQLGRAMLRVYVNGSRDPVASGRAREAVMQALALDSNSVAALTTAAAVYTTAGLEDPARAAALVAKALRIAPNDAPVLRLAGNMELDAGKVAEAVATMERARQVDPRSVATLGALQQAYVLQHRYDDALAAGTASFTISPGDLNRLQWQVMAHLAQGDLAGGQAEIRSAVARGVSAPAIVAFFAGYQEMSWALDQSGQQLLFRLTPAAFDNDRAWWGQSLATANWEQGNLAAAHAYADSALTPSAAQLAASPNDVQLRALHAVLLAYLGRGDEARREIARAVALSTALAASDRAYLGMQRVRVSLALGDTGEGLDGIELLLKEQSPVTPAWLRIDPTFKSLRGNPRFMKLVGR
jgi:serine/threonine-protein kinase